MPIYTRPGDGLLFSPGMNHFLFLSPLPPQASTNFVHTSLLLLQICAHGTIAQELRGLNSDIMRFSALPAAALLALAPSVTLAEDRVIAVTSPARDEVVPLNKPFIIQWSHPYGAFTGINAKFGLSGGPTNETMEDCGLIIGKQ